MTNLNRDLSIEISTQVILSEKRIELLTQALQTLNEKDEAARLCCTAPPMSGILASMISGSGAFWLPKGMRLPENQMYQPRFSTTLTAHESPTQVDVTICERPELSPLVFCNAHKKLGEITLFAEALLQAMNIEFNVISDETLFRNVLLENDMRKRRLLKKITTPWKQSTGKHFRA